jgi:hypothetical protein
MFIENLQGTYERSSTAETLKTIRQKHDESLRDYMNDISYIQDNRDHQRLSRQSQQHQDRGGDRNEETQDGG